MLSVQFLQPENIRYERKFAVSQLDRPQLEHIIMLHEGLFREIFYERTVNNIYLDTANLADYWDNVCGSPHRLKVRIRWYGELLGSIERPTLELKVKSGITSWKKSFPLPAFSLCQSFRFDDLLATAEEADLPPMVKELLKSRHPTLLNQYQRKYFLSANGKYRITLDTDMRYLPILKSSNTFLEDIRDYTNKVVELKYDATGDDQADHIAGSFPFRLTKNSKYVNGVNELNHWHN